jgi:hypothetical protein
MDVDEALTTLGFTGMSMLNKNMVRKAWKMRIAKKHPDKNQNPDAHKSSQMINEAKEVLLEYLDAVCLKNWEETGEHKYDKKSDFEDFMKAHMATSHQKEADIAEEMLSEKTTQSDADSTTRVKPVYSVDESKQMQEDQPSQGYENIKKSPSNVHRVNSSKNRKPRTPESRIHKTIEDYEEGRQLIEKMKEVFSEYFEERSGSYIRNSVLFEIFVKVREMDNVKSSNLEKTLFTRHGKRLFLARWTRSKYVQTKKQRCYSNVGVKKQI